MSVIRVTSVDPALANFGIARLLLNTESLTFEIESLELIETDKQSNKVIRQNSDDLRRAQELKEAFHRSCDGSTVCFAEIPSGAQNARAAMSFGIAVGVLASCPIPIIQVQNSEAKIVVTGKSTASKQEIIDWAGAKYPDAPWQWRGVKLLKKNEHLADAVAIAHAGLKTDQFKTLLAMWRATKIAA